MGWFNKKQDGQAGSGSPSADDRKKINNDPGNAVNGKRKFHTKRKSKSLIAQMKISESVPATVIDALRGDNSVINSDKDFVRAQKLELDGKIYYPVLVLDNETLEAAGLGEKQNRDVFGQISVGLKTSSGATGFLPVVTTQSLQQDYIGLLPMHDAFEILKSYGVFENYEPGFLLGLLNIDNDVLSLRRTDIRLNLHQWWDFVNSKLNFKVVDNHVKLDEKIPTKSDPLQMDAQEARGEDVDTNQLDPTREFDDDDQTASNSVISSFVDGKEAPQTAKSTSDDTDNGYSISDLDDLDEDDDIPVIDDDDDENKSVSGTPVDVNNQDSQSAESDSTDSASGLDQAQRQLDALTKSQTSSESQPASVQNNEASQSVAANQGSVNNNQPVIAQAQSQDELAADNATMGASVRTLNDLQISVSDKEFVDTYLNNLTVNHLPLEDESNDPTGKIHHLNQLRKEANARLDSALQDEKANLRSWFENQRSGLLEVLRKNTRTDGSQINEQRNLLNDLQHELDDDQKLKQRAKIQVDEQLKRLDDNFADELETAKRRAVEEVAQQFHQKRTIKDQAKDSLVAQAVADQRQRITNQISQIKEKIQSLAQNAASQSYTELMEQASGEFRAYQQKLAKRYNRQMQRIEGYEVQTRRDENRRIDSQAELKRSDSEVSSLRQQLSEIKARHKEAIEKERSDHELQLETIQNNDSDERRQAVSAVKDQMQEIERQRDEFKNRLDEQQQIYENRVNELMKQHKADIDRVRDDTKDTTSKSDHAVKVMRNILIGGVSASAVFALFIGFAAYGLGIAHDSNKANQQQTTPSIVYPYVQQQPTQQSSSSLQSSEQSSSSTSSSHKTHDSKKTSHEKQSSDSNSDTSATSTSDSSNN